MLEKIKLLTAKQKAAFLFLLVIVIALPLFITASKRSTEYRQRAAESTTPFFTLSPITANKSIDENFDIQLMLTNPANVIAIDITMAFDPSLIELINFKPTTSLSSILQKTDNQKGEIRYAGANTSSAPTTQDLATLTFKAKQTGTTDLSFLHSQIMIRGQQTAIKPDNNRKGTYTVENNALEKDVSLTLSPATGTFYLQKPMSLDIYLDAKTNKISGITFILNYDDGMKLENADIDKSLLNNILKNTINPNSYTFAAVDTIGKTVSGKVKLGTLTFIPQAEKASVTLSFSDVQITDLDTTGNISKNTYPNAGVYTILASGSTPSATPLTPTLTPTSHPNPTNPPLPTSTPIIPTTTPIGPVPGDATGDKLVDIRDYNRWKDEYLGTLTTKTADFNKGGRVDLIDFSIFRNGLNP